MNGKQIPIDKETYELLEVAAKEKGLTVQEYVHELTKHFLKDMEKMFEK